MQMLQQLIPVVVITLLIELAARLRARRMRPPPPPPYAPAVANFDTWTERDKRRLIEQMREVQLLRAPEDEVALHSALHDAAALRIEKNRAYSERNQLVALLSKLWPSYLAQHPFEDKAWDPEWRTIVFINAPMGQLSWHLHTSDLPLFEHLEHGTNNWDGHTTEEKYARIRAFRNT